MGRRTNVWQPADCATSWPSARLRPHVWLTLETLVAMRTSQSIFLDWRCLAVILSTPWLLNACATKSGLLAPIDAGLRCVDDSAGCRQKRSAALTALVNDRTNSWIAQPATPEAYASGVRLFAFRKRKQALSCAQLAQGAKEAQAARPSLRTASNRLSPAQIARGAMLGDEVALGT